MKTTPSGLLKLAVGLVLLNWSWPGWAAEGVPKFDDWLFELQIGHYVNLLHDPERVSEPVRDSLQQSAHNFAFAYWLFCQTNRAASSSPRRFELRDLLHSYAKNSRCFNDPIGELRLFKMGVPVYGVKIVGYNFNNLTEKDYLAMVKRFQFSYYDVTNAFPVPCPAVSEIADLKTKESDYLVSKIGGKQWRAVSASNLGLEFKNRPVKAFQLLNTTGKVYYLPAFMRMCEREPERVGQLATELLGELRSNSPQSVKLRAALTDPQKRCVLAFYEDWFREKGSRGVSLKELRRTLSVADEE